MPHFNVKTPRFYPSKNLEIITTKELYAELRTEAGGIYTQHSESFATEFANFNPWK